MHKPCRVKFTCTTGVGQARDTPILKNNKSILEIHFDGNNISISSLAYHILYFNCIGELCSAATDLIKTSHPLSSVRPWNIYIFIAKLLTKAARDIVTPYTISIPLLVDSWSYPFRFCCSHITGKIENTEMKENVSRSNQGVKCTQRYRG